jgi:hypothetical protein
MTLPPVSPLLVNAFNIARTKYRAEHEAWIKLSYVLSGRFNLTVAIMSLQRQGDLDLLLRCIEDEFDPKRVAAETPESGVYHYQLMLSEAWVVGCYEILRAFRQRDDDAQKAGVRHSGVSQLQTFRSVFADFELLRMPIAKFEIAKDQKMKQPLPMRTLGETDEVAPQPYDPKDPARYHIMPKGLSPRGSPVWLALDHLTNREYWIERRDLSERLLALGNEIVPAGLLEAQERRPSSRDTRLVAAIR